MLDVQASRRVAAKLCSKLARARVSVLWWPARSPVILTASAASDATCRQSRTGLLCLLAALLREHPHAQSACV